MLPGGLFSWEVSRDPVDSSGVPFPSAWLGGVHLSADETLCKPFLLCHCLCIWNLHGFSGTPLKNADSLEKDKAVAQTNQQLLMSLRCRILCKRCSDSTEDCYPERPEEKHSRVLHPLHCSPANHLVLGLCSAGAGLDAVNYRR